MKTAHRRAVVASVGTIALAALAVGCAPAPGEDDEATAAAEPTTDFLPCITAGVTGFDDQMFNELNKEGMDQAAAELGAQVKAVEATAETDYAANIDSLVAEGCDLVVTAGFDFSEVTLAAAEANPDVLFAIVDDAADADGDGKSDFPNLKPLLFDSAEAMFLTGYAAASYSNTGVVGLYGGMAIPPVTVFMDGFVLGVEHYNKVKNADVQVLGWDVETQDGVFTGSFAANETAKTTSKNLLDQGADVVVPIAASAYVSTAEAIIDSGKDVVMIGGDGDMAVNAPEYAELWLVSALKGVSVAVHDVVIATANGEFTNDAYVGTLANGGVSISSFHDFEDDIDPGLLAELDELSAQIVDGEVEISSPSSPR
jgi:basic membrane protein A and related proteins